MPKDKILAESFKVEILIRFGVEPTLRELEEGVKQVVEDKFPGSTFVSWELTERHIVDQANFQTIVGSAKNVLLDYFKKRGIKEELVVNLDIKYKNPIYRIIVELKK